MTFDEANHIHMPVAAINHYHCWEIFDPHSDYSDVIMYTSTEQIAQKAIELVNNKLKKIQLQYRFSRIALPIHAVALSVEQAIEQFRKYLR